MELAALMMPALLEPMRVKGASAKKRSKASREASEEEGLEVKAFGETDIVDLVDEEDDEAVTSMHGGHASDDDDDNDNEGDDGDDEVDDDNEEPHQGVEDEEVAEEELGRSSMETPRQTAQEAAPGVARGYPRQRGVAASSTGTPASPRASRFWWSCRHLPGDATFRWSLRKFSCCRFPGCRPPASILDL